MIAGVAGAVAFAIGGWLVLTTVRARRETRPAKRREGDVLRLPGGDLHIKIDGAASAPPLVLLSLGVGLAAQYFLDTFLPFILFNTLVLLACAASALRRRRAALAAGCLLALLAGLVQATGWSLRVGIAVLALIVVVAAIISVCSNRLGAPRQLPE